MAKIENYIPKINARNKKFAEQIRSYAKKYSIVGVVDVEGLPALQFQRIRASVKKTAEVLIVKKNLIDLVLTELEPKFPGIRGLMEKANGVVGLVFTNDNPFTLYKFVQKNRSTAPAKGGQIAPKNILVPAGPTGFSPGPIIGELGAFKIKAGINAGKVEIKEDAIVAKEGDEISPKLAEILGRLGVEPMEVGLNIKAIYEEGTIYGRSVLEVDEDKIISDLKAMAFDAFRLSVGLEYPVKENINVLLSNAARDALGLGVGIEYPAAETMNRLLSKANAQMSGVAITLPEELRPAGLAVASAKPVAVSNESANEESKKEESKESSEEDVSAGFGGFF